MDKLSKLLKQARPLYKVRKRRKFIAKTILLITVPVLFGANIASLYVEGDKIYTSFENNNLQNELLNDDFGITETIIETNNSKL